MVKINIYGGNIKSIAVLEKLLLCDKNISLEQFNGIVINITVNELYTREISFNYRTDGWYIDVTLNQINDNELIYAVL